MSAGCDGIAVAQQRPELMSTAVCRGVEGRKEATDREALKRFLGEGYGAESERSGFR